MIIKYQYSIHQDKHGRKSVIDRLAVVAGFAWMECSHLAVVYLKAISMGKMDLQHTKS